MPTTASKQNLIFGAGNTPKPLRNWPPGKVRIIQKNDDFVYARVSSPGSVRWFVVVENEGYWEPLPGELETTTVHDSPGGYVERPESPRLDFWLLLEMQREYLAKKHPLACLWRNASSIG